MGMLCAVSFNRYGRLYYFDPGELNAAVGDRVLVPTDDGPEVAECVWAAQWISDDTAGFPRLVGLAGEEDLRRDKLLRTRKAEAKVAAKRLIREHDLPMKVVAIDHVLDSGGQGPRTTIYFTAPHRVDFRSLDQDLPLNPLRISGACGRLMCCLKYEHPLYQQFQASAPAVGSRVSTPDGDGRVVGHSVPRDAVVVRLDADGSRCSCSRASVCGSRQGYEQRYG